MAAAAAVTPGYDLDGARAAGVSDDEILQHLAQSRGYDLDSALKAGVSKDEIMQHLAQKPARKSMYADQPASSPAAQPPPVSIPGPGAGSPSGSGFGTSGMTLTPPPELDTYLTTTPAYRAALGEAYKTTVERAAQAHQLEDVAAFNQRQRNQQVDELIRRGVKLSPREEAIARTGISIAPERGYIPIPGTVTYAELTAQEKADNPGISSEPAATFRRRADPETGKIVLEETTPMTDRSVEPDSSSSTGFSQVFRNRVGQEISRTRDFTPPAAFVPQTVTTGGSSMITQQVVGPDGRLVEVQVPSPHAATTTTVRRLPNAGPQTPSAGPSAAAPSRTLIAPPGTPAGPAPAAAPGTPALPAGLPKGSRVIGTPAAQYKLDIQQPLSPVAQSVVVKTQPVVNNLDRLLKQLEPYKNSDVPGTTLLPRIAYAMGFGSGQKGVDSLLSNLEMTGITSAASALSGSTRARQFVEKALIHTPDSWKDSGSLMYNKVATIRQRLQDILDVANGPEGRRNPGLVRPPAPLEKQDPDNLRQFIKAK